LLFKIGQDWVAIADDGYFCSSTYGSMLASLLKPTGGWDNRIAEKRH